MGFFKKTITIPSGEKADVQAYDVWHVRWTSRHGEYSHDTRPEVEAFTTQEDADRFATELKTAFRLIRHTRGIGVTVEKSSYKGV